MANFKMQTKESMTRVQNLVHRLKIKIQMFENVCLSTVFFLVFFFPSRKLIFRNVQFNSVNRSKLEQISKLF